MKIARRLCTTGLCALLALEVGAAELPARIAGARSDTEQAADRHSSGPVVTPGRAPISAQRGTGKFVRSNSDGVQSLLHAQPAKTVARATGRPTGAKHAAPAVAAAAIREPRKASPVVPSRLSPSRGAVQALPSVKRPIRGSSIGGPKIAGAGRVGGPPTGRRANHGAIDGAEVHRHF